MQNEKNWVETFKNYPNYIKGWKTRPINNLDKIYNKKFNVLNKKYKIIILIM